MALAARESSPNRGAMPSVLSLAATLGAAAAASGGVNHQDTQVLVPPTDKSLFFSEHNWAMQPGAASGSTVAVSVNAGAYIKAVFSGSSHASFALEATRPGPTGGVHYMNVVFSIDNRDLIEVPILGNTTEVAVSAHCCDPNTTHTLQLFIYNSLQGANRWDDPAHGGAALVVKGLTLERGAKLTPPPLLPRRAIFFGDSITEGVNAECVNPTGCSGASDLCNNAATKTWGPTVAAALGAEYSQVGFGSLGWVVSGAGGVPAFFSPSEPGGNSWDKHFSNANRSLAGLDYIFVGHATNDGLRTQRPAP